MLMRSVDYEGDEGEVRSLQLGSDGNWLNESDDDDSNVRNFWFG